MGANGSGSDRRIVEWSKGSTMAEVWAKDAERKAQEQRMIEDARADAMAVWALADYCLPADWDEFAKRNGMPETLREMWRNAFIVGWRAALRYEASTYDQAPADD